MTNKTKIAVFASGSGSNFVAIQEACQAGELAAEVLLLVTDKPAAAVLDRAKELGVPAAAFSPQAYATREAYERAILERLQACGVEWIVLAGYMKLIGPTLLQAYPSKIINIHPSLLPSFVGKDAVHQAVDHGVKITGVTVHLVDAGMDTGPILAQEAVRVVEGDVAKTFEAIQQVEHQLYKKTLHTLFMKNK